MQPAMKPAINPAHQKNSPCQYPATCTHSPQGPAAALASATVANTEATATLEKVLFEEVTASSPLWEHSCAFGGQTPASCCQVGAAEALSGLWQWSASLCHREMRTPRIRSIHQCAAQGAAGYQSSNQMEILDRIGLWRH